MDASSCLRAFLILSKSSVKHLATYTRSTSYLGAQVGHSDIRYKLSPGLMETGQRNTREANNVD